MTFARKIFIAVFLSTFLVGTLLIWGAHYYVASHAESDFISRYNVFAKILADTLTRLDTNTEALMLNAAQVVSEKDKAEGLLSTEELRALQSKLGITHLFVINRDGRFVRSTNDDPAGIPNLFLFSPTYRKLLTGEVAVEATPVIKPDPEPKPFKFLSIPNHDRSRIIEVGVRVDFIANTLVEAVASDKNVLNMSLYAPDGTHFGTFSEENVVFETQKAQVPQSFESPLDNGDTMKFYSKVTSSHTKCAQCDVSGTSINGEYYYVLESTVSKAELKSVLAKASYIFLLLGFANALLALALARWLSRRLVKNIEAAVTRVRSMKALGTFDGRIGLQGKDEVVFLTQEFDRLLDSMEDSQRKLVQAEKFESKVELARIVAHNIRSPILAIEMMIPGLNSVPERMKRVLKSAVREIKELTEKLKTQSEAITVPSSEMDTDLVYLPIFLSDLTKQKELELSSYTSARITLEMPTSSEPVFVKASSLELKSVLSNLINNARESYGPAGGKIEVSLSVTNTNCRISVSDQGAGIPKEYLDCLGKRRISFKGDASRGLGLTHAFESVACWGGNITFESEVECGTTVHVSLPIYKESQAKTSTGLETLKMR